MPGKASALIPNARSLRRSMTDAERALWQKLRSNQFQGLRFRRQAVIGRYIADFACFDPKLVIELDGGQHADQASYDEARTSWLTSEGFIVLRFWNNDVLSNIDGVLESIAAAVKNESRPPP